MEKLSFLESEISKFKEITIKNTHEIDSLQQSIIENRNLINQLEKEKAELLFNQSQNSGDLKLLESLTKNLEDLLTEKSDIMMKLGKSEKEYVELKQKFDLAENELSKEHILLEKTQNEVNSQKAKIDLILMSIDSLTSERDSALKLYDNSKKDDKKCQDYILQLTSQLEKLQQDVRMQNTKKDTDNYLSNEVTKLRDLLSKKEDLIYEKSNHVENLTRSLDSAKIDVQMYITMNERLQDELARMQEGGDEDTFENVMRHELAMMRESYEKKIKEIKESNEANKKKSWQEIKQLKEDIKHAEHSREIAELRLKSYLVKV